MESNESNEDTTALDTTTTTSEVSPIKIFTHCEKDVENHIDDKVFCEKLLVLQKHLQEISDNKKNSTQAVEVSEEDKSKKISTEKDEAMEIDAEQKKDNNDSVGLSKNIQISDIPLMGTSTSEEAPINIPDSSDQTAEEVTEEAAIELSLDSSSDSLEEKPVEEVTEKPSEDLLEKSVNESAEKQEEKAEKKPVDTNVVTTGERRESKRKRSLNVTVSARTSPVEENGTSSATNSPSKRKKLEEKPFFEILDDDGKSDRYCWRCHKEAIEARCSMCPRSWHRRCMGGAPPLSITEWVCSECTGILQAENKETRSPVLAHLTPDLLCMMLRYIVERMREQTGSAPFLKAVDTKEVPNYLDYIIKPMDLSLLDSNVCAKLYSSTDAFMADAKWIQHNCIVFNTYTSKLTNTAKQMLKVARQEVSEIEACPDCFALGRNLPRPLSNWFIQPCWKPHPIVWAKLKGFPFWPAKALPRLNTQGLVDVRFFGEHDRAWVSPKDIYLYSEEPPAPLPKKKKPEMDECMKEVQEHSKKLREVFGLFRYAPSKLPYDPHDPMQIKVLLPQYDPTSNKRTVGSKEIKTIPLSIPLEKSPIKVERRPKTPIPEKRPKTPVSEKRPKTPVPEKRSKTPVPEKRPKTPLPEKRPKTPVAEKRPKTPVAEKRPKTPLPEKRPKTPVLEKRSKTPLPERRSKTPLPERRSKTPIPKNVATNTNGLIEATVELRKSLRRKQMEESPLRPPINKAIPDPLPVPVVVPKLTKNSTKTPTSSPPAGNNTSPPANKKEPVKNNSTPQNKNSEAKAGSGIKNKAITNAKNAKAENLLIKKKIKLVKDLINKEEITITTKSNSLKNGSAVVNSMPAVTALNSLKNNPELLKSLKLNHKSKTLLIQQPNSKKTALIISPKMNSKSPQVENNIIQVLNAKSQSDAKRSLLNNVQKNNKNGSQNKPMISIPMSNNKDQIKAIFQSINYNPSESPRTFNDKELKVNTTHPVIKQEPKDDMLQPKLTFTRKPSKARKSLPNKPTNFSSPVSVAASNPLNKSTSSIANKDARVYISPQTSILRPVAPTSFQLPPPEAGPNTASIHKSSKDLAAKVAKLIADTIREAAENNDGSNSINQYDARIQFLKLKIEKMNWEHQQEIAELKHNNDLVIRELKASMEVERYRALQDARREAEMEKIRCVEETKRKQWCVNCGREAKFYCCWNTAYCDYPCQQKHWASHYSSCSQKATANNNANTSTSSTTSIVPTAVSVSQPKGTQKQPMPKLVIYKPKTSAKKA